MSADEPSPATRDGNAWSRFRSLFWLTAAEALALFLGALIPMPWRVFAVAIALLLFPFILMAIYWRPPKRED
jgi:hypothetical protein